MTNLLITKEDDGFFYLWVNGDMLGRYSTDMDAIERAENYKKYTFRPDKCSIVVNLTANK